MSRPIKLTDELLKSITGDFVAAVKNTKMTDGKITYTKNFKWDTEEKAQVVFTPTAYAKMMALIQGFSTEVAWHGVVARDEAVPNKFHITDILVYPQIVTAGTANTDQIPYQNWLYSFDDETFRGIRMQGHSHVNYSVNPSATDLDHQSKMLGQLGDDMFYIFMIWNKQSDRFVRIYDLANNTLYESEDVEVLVGDVNLSGFLAEARKVVSVRAAYQPSTAVSQTAQNVSKKGKEKKGKSKEKLSNYDEEDGCYGAFGYYEGPYYSK